MNEKEQDFKATPRDESWFSRTGVEQLEENVEIKEWKLQHGSRSGICLNKIRTQGPTLTLEKKQKNPEVLCQELKTRGSSDALRKTEERKEQRRNKSQKKKGKNKATVAWSDCGWVTSTGTIHLSDSSDHPTEIFSAIYNQAPRTMMRTRQWLPGCDTTLPAHLDWRRFGPSSMQILVRQIWLIFLYEPLDI